MLTVSYLLVLAAFLFCGIATSYLVHALSRDSIADLLTKIRTRPFYSQAVRYSLLVAWGIVGLPLVVFSILLRAYLHSPDESVSDMLGVGALAMVLGAAGAAYYFGKRVEERFTRQLLADLVRELNVGQTHDQVFLRYAPYVSSWAEVEARNIYQVTFRPPEIITPFPFESELLDIVSDPASNRWQLSKPWRPWGRPA